MARGFPVQVQNPDLGIPPSAYRGGFGTSSFSIQTVTKTQIANAPPSASIGGNLYGLTAGFGPQPGKALELYGFYITSTKLANFYIRVGVATGPLAGQNIPEIVPVVTVGPDANGRPVPVWVPCPWVVRNGQSVIPYITKILDATADDTQVTFYPLMNTTTDNFNTIAVHTFMWIGTSITNGTGPTSTAYMYHTQVESYFRSKGVSCRNDLYGRSGSATANHYTNFLKGEYDFDKYGNPPSVVVIELSVNDASTGVTAGPYTTRMRAYCERFLNHPEKDDVIVIVLGGTPLENNTNWTNLISLDTATETMVAELSENAKYTDRIFFLKLRDSYNRLDRTKVASSDAVGGGIHPNDIGCTDVTTNSWIPWIDGSAGQIIINKLK